MAFQPERMYEVMACAYRQGVTDRFMPIFGEALQGVMVETGMNLEDLLNRMDEAQVSTLEKLDERLERMGAISRFAANQRLMRATSRLLDLPWIRKAAVRGLQAFLVRAATGESSKTSPIAMVKTLFPGKRICSCAGKTCPREEEHA